MKELKYTWKQFDDDVEKLVRKVKRSKFHPKTIVAMSRGGLSLGVKLSHKLKCPLLIISAKTYSDSKKQMDTVILNSSYTVPLQSPVLIADEISDSGTTLRVLASHFETCAVEFKTLTLHYKPHTKVKPDYFAASIADETWAIYPWEK
jgi:hypoxanthine phosphoribosyltransferase